MTNYQELREQLVARMSKLRNRASRIEQDLRKPGDRDSVERANEIENDEVLSAMVAVGRTLGVGGKIVAVPARELQYVHENDTWQIQMTKAQLEELPAFDEASVELKKTEVATRDRPLR